MAENIVGSKMPTFPSQAKQPGRFYRGLPVKQRADLQPDKGYGENGYTGSSSVMGTGRIAANLSDMDTTPPKGDAVLDAVIDRGHKAADDNFQTRKVDASSRPVTYGMHAPAKGAHVPAKTGTSSAQPVRKPGQ